MNYDSASDSNQESNYAQLIKWVDSATSQEDERGHQRDENGETSLALSLGDDAHIVARDLDGILESAESIRRRILGLLESTPNGDTLEDVLVAVEIDLAHAVRHWRDTLLMLSERDLWSDPEFFERQSRVLGN